MEFINWFVFDLMGMLGVIDENDMGEVFRLNCDMGLVDIVIVLLADKRVRNNLTSRERQYMIN